MTEKVCVGGEEDLCMEKMHMLWMEEMVGLDAIYGDGIIGMAPSAQRTG